MFLCAVPRIRNRRSAIAPLHRELGAHAFYLVGSAAAADRPTPRCHARRRFPAGRPHTARGRDPRAPGTRQRSRPGRDRGGRASSGFFIRVSLRHIEQRITLVTLGVSDYAKAKAFYAALGWRPALEVEETAFFQGNGIILVLWAREKLGPDMGIPDDGARWSAIALAQNVRSREEVHAVMEDAREHGAGGTREPGDTFYGGYAAAFRGVRGHPWALASNTRY